MGRPCLVPCRSLPWVTSPSRRCAGHSSPCRPLQVHSTQETDVRQSSCRPARLCAAASHPPQETMPTLCRYLASPPGICGCTATLPGKKPFAFHRYRAPDAARNTSRRYVPYGQGCAGTDGAANAAPRNANTLALRRSEGQGVDKGRWSLLLMASGDGSWSERYITRSARRLPARLDRRSARTPWSRHRAPTRSSARSPAPRTRSGRA
jgi:hypothetical protein